MKSDLIKFDTMISMFDKYVLSQQIVQTLIQSHILQHFILVFTVCLNLIIIMQNLSIYI